MSCVLCLPFGDNLVDVVDVVDVVGLVAGSASAAFCFSEFFLLDCVDGGKIS